MSHVLPSCLVALLVLVALSAGPRPAEAGGGPPRARATGKSLARPFPARAGRRVAATPARRSLRRSQRFGAPSSRYPAHSPTSHAAATKQRASLDAVLRAVEASAQRGERPVVQVDLDFTAINPTARVRETLALAFEEHGVDAAVPPVLSSHYLAPFLRMVRQSGLHKRVPGTDWAAVHATFRKLFEAPKRLSLDEGAPGIERFVRDVRARGGEVVFNTLRPESWRPETERTLGRIGLGDVSVAMKPAAASESGDIKAATVRRLHAEGRVTVAIIDDHPDNLQVVDRVVRGLGGRPLVRVLAAAPGYTGFLTPAEVRRRAHAVATFERE